ncbi:hypothetical protein LTR66_009601 [Elasticomyces elasticus]|nr:hypothetical protein LTR66_009601 [Elasticomyces elasticus]
MGVDWKLLIPTIVKNEIMDLVRNEPRAKEMYDELVTTFCKPTPEQLDQLKPNEAMLDALFEHSNPVEAREMTLSKLAANNGELAKLNQELGLKVSDHAFPEDLGRRLIEALKRQDAPTANQLAGQIKAVMMLQGDPAHERIRADLPDAAVEAARASHMPNLIAAVEDSRTTALAGPVSPLVVPTSAGSPVDIDSPRDGDKTEVISNGVPSANRTAADGPEDKNGIPVGALKGPGFVFDDGCWKEILGYRPVGRGHQLHIRTEAPSVCKLVKASLYGKETVTDYEKAMRSKSSKPTIFEETACDLKKASWDSLLGKGAGIFTLTSVQREARARRPHVNKPVTYLHIRTQDGSEVPAMAPKESGGVHGGSDPRSKVRGRAGEGLGASLESLQRDLDKKYEDKLKSVITAFQEELGRLEAEMLRRTHMMQNGVGLGISTYTLRLTSSTALAAQSEGNGNEVLGRHLEDRGYDSDW